MNQFIKRGAAMLLTVILLLSVSLPVSVSAAGTGYTSASDVVYKTQDGTIANWGYRGEVATFLSKYATAFYTGNDSYENLSKLSGSNKQNSVPDSALYKALQELMTGKHANQTSYGETRYLFCYTDCQMNDTSTILSFYSGTSMSGEWNSGKTWNREHVWPQSKTPEGSGTNNGTSGERADIIMLRPTITAENSARGNEAYGLSSGFQDPGKDVRGDCARILLYTYVRWGNAQYMWGKSGVMESVNILLDWMGQDPVDTWEMGRNDSVESITGTRNVFVDYPELAWQLFGKEVPAGLSSPTKGNNGSINGGGNTGSTGENTGSTGGNTGSTGGSVTVTGGEKLTSLDQLKNGSYVLVVDNGIGMGALDGTWVTTAKPTISGNKLSDADGAVWTLTVNGDKVTLQDANGTYIAPKGGNNNGIKEGKYEWTVTCEDGKFRFAGNGSDTVYLASNSGSENKFRGYKTSTCTGSYADDYPHLFSLYAVTVTGGNAGSTGGNSGGNTGSTGGNTGSTSMPTVQTAPVAGTAYKLGLNQKNIGKALYFAGEMSKNFLATTENIDSAVDVIPVAVNGGWHLSFQVGGKTQYIEIHEYEEGKLGVHITDTPTNVFTWDSTTNTFFSTVAGQTRYLGTYKEFNTISSSNITYITGENAANVDVSQFPVHLYLPESSGGSTGGDQPGTEDTQPTTPNHGSEPTEDTTPTVAPTEDTTPTDPTEGTQGNAACSHSFGDWTVTKKPTANEQGTQERVCSQCGAKQTKPIARLETSYTWLYIVLGVVAAAGISAASVILIRKRKQS